MPRAEVSVAHFRTVWDGATETFVYDLVRSARATRPLLIGFERAHADAFPHAGPVLTLYPPGSFAARWRRLRLRLWGRDSEPGFPPWRVASWLARHDARVLHAHFGDVGTLLLPLRRRTGLPLVTSFYGHDASRLARMPEWRRRFRELFDQGDAFLAEGPALAGRLRDLGCPPHKLHIQRIAIDVARYPFRARAAPEGRPARLFFCARFTEKKGLPEALEALARVRDRHPGVSLRIGGDGPQRPAIDAAIRRLHLDGAVELLGMLSHARMIEELDRCDIFVQPSLTAADGDSEGGAPTTLLEAQACGIPTLTTAHADIPAVVDRGRSALLSPEGDVVALARNLDTLLTEPGRWRAMGAAGRAWVERRHDLASEGERLEKLYAELIAAHPHVRPGLAPPESAPQTEQRLPWRVPQRSGWRVGLLRSLWSLPEVRRLGAQSHQLLVHLIVHQRLADAAGVHLRGRLIDIGCGRKPYESLLSPYVLEHVGVDHAGSLHDASSVDLVGSVYDLPVPSSSFDSALCSATLEHFEEPAAAIRECFRVLKPGGKAVYTVPFIWHVHEEPRDFYRYTRFGLEHLFRKAGFDLVEIEPLSGFWITFGQLLAYNVHRLDRGLLGRTGLAKAAALAIQAVALGAELLDRTEQWTWMYWVVVRRPPVPAETPTRLDR